MARVVEGERCRGLCPAESCYILAAEYLCIGSRPGEERAPMCKYKLMRLGSRDYECNKPAWEKSEEGYCIFHEPGKDKDTELFDIELQKEKLETGDYEFVGFVFPGETPYFGKHKFENDVDFTEATFLGKTSFFNAKFLGGFMIDFRGAKFSGNTTSFIGAEFSGYTDFNRAKFLSDTTFFNQAKFWGDTIFNSTQFLGDRTDFRGAVFAGGLTDFRQANLRGVDLTGVNLSGVDLRYADIRKTILVGANLENANVTGIKFARWGRYSGIRVATCHGSPLFKRFAQDQDFLEEFREAWWRKPLYFLWLISCDCGRSFSLWAGWCVIIALFFASIYFCHIGPSAFRIVSNLPHTFGTFLYYSVVTLTTLGFGDITPNTPYAARWVMAEVILGYIMLGGLISIFATKLARRS